MAIRDRITVKTKDGSTTELVVRKQGGFLELVEPKPPRQPYFRIAVMNKQGEETGESLLVPTEEILFIRHDKAPK